VRIGTDPLLATTVASTVVDQLARRYARIVFHLMATQPAMLHRELSERNVDLLIAPRLGALADGAVQVRKTLYDPYVVAAGARSRWV
jgi:DNA-binding transcriptional LysR family regulator